MTTTAAAESTVSLSCPAPSMYPSDVALMERQSFSKSLLSMSPEFANSTPGVPNLTSSANNRGGPCLRNIGDNRVDEDRYDDDLVTPCQGLLNKYVDYSSADGQSVPLHFNDHPQLKEIAHSNLKALMGSHHGGGGGPPDSSSIGSDNTWQGSFLSQLPSTMTSPTTSYEQNSSQASLSNTLPAPSLTGNKKTQYKKTKLCPWHRDGKCFMGSACNYAHSREELRPKPDLSKTKLCPELAKGKQCTHGGCRFAHDFVELRATSAFFKTRICKFWQRGICPAGAECRHAHGREDLRPTVGAADLLPAPVSARQAPTRSMLSSSCSVQSDGAWTVDDIPLATNDVAPPPASSIPSPSFLSTTASTPSPATQPISSEASAAQLAQTLRQCAALLTEQSVHQPVMRPLVADDGSLNVLRSWIAQEVEKQVQLRQAANNNGRSNLSLPSDSGSHSSPPPNRVTTPESFQETPLKNREMPNYLPSTLIQGLNLSPVQISLPPSLNPVERGWISPKAASDANGGGSTPAFANAVRGLFKNAPTAAASPPPGLLPTDWVASSGWHNSQLGF
eukprot:Gregarina_sp_Poly_1__971@NODE_1236_length_4689_cov_699_025314_g842_i0_p1_GENE_NODE_1236_length_4689_cov_699_025314_g842_i0NODE_1236_length_4689_cov_699_025314_g842_i0_p1_ORF_typecomplete_len563_score76_69zfCCCH/PF00642_24/0_0012zfCCCH/PF00642_24/0_25zfCCCH/PF00642_24/1_9e07zfCCCH_3/PF15663_5/0_0013zfCCCH_3/PF15663_5/0_00095Torus/PF16131_5/0_027Torus/PF16131_5/8_4e02Torus/PF16131_5/0_24zfCCCH_4/PF18044_1/34zfCCCH_4/PF18044_1/13zfCCCH_4/PF18044_1/0_0019zf_CCCH_4/PF18345_1/1_2e02zf_CCCH_4/PF18345_1